MADPTDPPADPPELPDWERDLNERALRWARGALPRDHPDHPNRDRESPTDGS